MREVEAAICKPKNDTELSQDDFCIPIRNFWIAMRWKSLWQDGMSWRVKKQNDFGFHSHVLNLDQLNDGIEYLCMNVKSVVHAQTVRKDLPVIKAGNAAYDCEMMSYNKMRQANYQDGGFLELGAFTMVIVKEEF